MKKQSVAILMLIIVCLALGFLASQGAVAQDEEVKEPTRLAVLWTSDDPLMAHRMLLMYVGASQRANWFDENLIIVWGPSAKIGGGRQRGTSQDPSDDENRGQIPGLCGMRQHVRRKRRIASTGDRSEGNGRATHQNSAG